MKYANEDWKQERASWRAVIHLNLIRSVTIILQTMEAEMLNDPISSSEVLHHSLATTATDNLATREQLPVLLTNKHQLLKLRLSPLQRVEADLKCRLGAGTEEDKGRAGAGDSTRLLNRRNEFRVRAWKDALSHLVKHRGRLERQKGEMHQQSDDATEVIASCKEDMKALWTDEVVRSVLAKRNMRVEDSAGL